MSYGITDPVNLVAGLPYQWNRTKEEDAVTSDENGISDVSLELKWRFYDKDKLRFALKPGATLPTGDEGREV